MADKHVYSVCGMCTVRCPIQVSVKDGSCMHVFGNPHAAGVAGALCARGAAGTALVNDDERPQQPMIRVGERGEGKWRPVSWDEALDYVATKLNDVRQQYGDQSVLFSDRGGPFSDVYRAFLRGINTPNYCNHDAACARNVQHAALSVFGFGRKTVSYDFKNAKHVVLQSRNIFEAINVKEVNDLLDAMEQGGKLSVVDIRANITAAKANNFFMIRPGTDYAFNLAVLHLLIERNIYNKPFADSLIHDFDKLKAFVEPYTPQWAEQETGIKAEALEYFVWQLAGAAPAVIWHPGWMTARYKDSFYVSRTAYLINALLGSIGAKGGLPFANKPGNVGRKALKQLMDLFPKPQGRRVDGAGWEQGRTHFDAGPGLVNLTYNAIATGKPYPIKVYIVHRHDPLMAFPDTENLKEMWANLDLLVSVTFTWSETAWFSDVVLPLSPYLERESVIATKNGLKPQFFVRHRALTPRFDTKSEWEIYCGLAKRMGLEALAFDAIEDIWNYQLQDTGLEITDFEAKGFVELASKPLYRPAAKGMFKTPSGLIEVVDAKLEADGLPSLKPYEAPLRPEKGQFRLTFGRCGVHTQGHTLNNPLLFEQMSENVLWINTDIAAANNITDGDYVEITGSNGKACRIKAFVTDFIHPEAVFMLHGFGHTLPIESRARGKGVADHELMPRGIHIYDKAGGAVAMQEHFVSVRAVS